MSDKMWDILRFLRPSPEEELINALNNKEKMNMDSQLLKGIEAQIDKVEEEALDASSTDETLYPSIQADGAKLIPISEEEYSPIVNDINTPDVSESGDVNKSETPRVFLDELVQTSDSESMSEDSQDLLVSIQEDEISAQPSDEALLAKETQERLPFQEIAEKVVPEEVQPNEEALEVISSVSVETLQLEDERSRVEEKLPAEQEKQDSLHTNTDKEIETESAMLQEEEPHPLDIVLSLEDSKGVEGADEPVDSPLDQEDNVFQPLAVAIEENIILEEEAPHAGEYSALQVTEESKQKVDPLTNEASFDEDNSTSEAREDEGDGNTQEVACEEGNFLADEKQSIDLLLIENMELPTEESIGRGRQLKEIPLSEIIPNPYQPRLIMVEEDITELAESIREVGVLQPILVRRADVGYELIAGERRFRAAKEVGLATIPALIADVDPLEQQLIALVENLQRKNLSAVEEGRCLQDILSKTQWSQTELAKRLGRSQAAVANKIRLLKLDSVVQQWVMEGKLGERQARTLLSFDPEEQKELGFQAIEQELSVKALEAVAAAKLAQKSHPEKKTSGRLSKKKTASNRDLIQDVADLVSQHRDKGTVAEWKVCEMTENTVLIEIRIDLTKKEQNEVNR